MDKKIIRVIILVIVGILIGNSCLALDNEIFIDDATFSFISKEEKLEENFDDSYKIFNENDENYELRQQIKELTKKVTYLLIGEPNKEYESSEEYFKRHKEYLKIRYNPKVPKDENTNSGLDENSQEYKDDLLSGISVPRNVF